MALYVVLDTPKELNLALTNDIDCLMLSLIFLNKFNIKMMESIEFKIT